MEPSLRIYLAGRVAIEGPSITIDERDLPGRQGRVALAFLASDFQRPVPRSALAEALWGDALPASWDSALSAVVSKLRGVLTTAGLDGPAVLSQTSGSYQLRLPTASWVDVEAAGAEADEAEARARTGDLGAAYGPAMVAASIASRPFLPGVDGDWADVQRSRLRILHLRALDCLAQVWSWRGEHGLAYQVAEDAVALEPLRESGHRRLMQVHAAAGNRAEALRAFERCRRLLVDELGVDPSSETEAVYLGILRSP